MEEPMEQVIFEKLTVENLEKVRGGEVLPPPLPYASCIP